MPNDKNQPNMNQSDNKPLKRKPRYERFIEEHSDAFEVVKKVKKPADGWSPADVKPLLDPE